MKQTTYNKLVRDRIPEIIEASGKTCVTEILSDEAYLKMVDAKLDEELAEYHKDQNIEELADLLEVLLAATIARGYTLEQLEQVRAEKAAKRGGFTRKLLLKAVADPTEPDTLAATICQNRTAIFAKIDAKMLSTYYWLMENLHTRNVSTDQEYRKKFGGYYVMRFVSQEYRDAFFSLFEQIKNQPNISFEEVSRKLFEVDGKHEFSFISKMLHTINPERPIYDSQVDAALKIHRTYQSDFNKKLQQDTQILNDIAACCQNLASAPEMAEILAAFDQIVPAHKMSVEKSWTLSYGHLEVPCNSLEIIGGSHYMSTKIGQVDLSKKIRELYSITKELELQFPGRKFTPDGHLVGSIGEVLVADYYGLKLLPNSTEIHDAIGTDGKFVQIKATQIKRIAISSEPDHLIVIKILDSGEWEEVYNGPGSLVWRNAGKMQKNGQRPITLAKLKSLMQNVREEEKIQPKK